MSKDMMGIMAVVMVLALSASIAFSAMSDDADAEGEVAEYDGAKYASLCEAVGAVETSGTVKMIADSTETQTIVILEGKDITLDLNNHDVTAVASESMTSLLYVNGTLTVEAGDDPDKNNLSIVGPVSTATTKTIRVVGSEGKPAALTVNGGTVNGYDRAVQVEYDSTFALEGGSICNGSDAVILFDKAEFTMSGGSISVQAGDTAVSALNESTVLVTGGKIVAGALGSESDGSYAIYMGNSSSLVIGEEDSDDSGIVIESGCYGVVVVGTASAEIKSGTIRAGGFGISGNGSSGNSVSITVSGGVIESEDAGIYMPGQETLTITGGEIIAKKGAGVEIRAGTASISGASIKSEGDPYEVNPNGNGSTTDGTAIAVVQHTTKQPISLEIAGGTFEGARALSISNPQGNSSEDIGKVSVTVSGGNFTGDIVNDTEGNLVITDEMLASLESNLKGVCVLVQGDSSYTVHPDLAIAVDAIVSGKPATIKLLEDAVLDADAESIMVSDGKEITLDLNGYDVVCNSNTKGTSHLILDGATLIITGSGSLYEAVEDGYSPVIIYGSTDQSESEYSVFSVGQDVHISGWAGCFVNVKDESAYGVVIDIYGHLQSPGVSDHTVTGHAVYVNGTVMSTGANAVIMNIHDGAELVSSGIGMYIAGYAKVTIGDDEEGDAPVIDAEKTGIEIRAGELTINKADITAHMGPTSVSPNGNGTTTEGAAIAVARHTTAQSLDVRIVDGTFKAYTAVWQSDPQENTDDSVAISIEGGKFTSTGGSVVYSENFEKFITGGAFSSEPDGKYVADGYVVKLIDGFYNVLPVFTVTWITGESVLTQTYEYGTTPVYSGPTPSMKDTAVYTYRFSGWFPAITKVTGDAKYTATFVKETKGDVVLGAGSEFYSGLLKYRVVSSDPVEVEVIGHNGAKGDVTVPGAVSVYGKRYSVVSVAEKAFYGCTALTSIDLGSVQSVALKAFANCTALKSVVIPESLKAIGGYAFYNCGLASVDITGDGVDIGRSAFSACKSMKDIEFSGTGAKIGTNAFYKNNGVSTLDLSGVSVVGFKAFPYCNGIKTLTIPGDIASIGGYAFFKCASLKEVVIEEGVKTLERSAFSGCTSIEKITFPSTLKTVGPNAFYGLQLLDADGKALSKAADLRGKAFVGKAAKLVVSARA